MANFYHPYILASRGSLNAVSWRHDFPGALIRVDDGIGCLHPWPEFGDAPIDGQLKLLRDGGSTPVIERALHMAAVDGEARRRGVSLFAGLEVPPSHYSWDLNRPQESQWQHVIGEGWRAVKLKGSAKVEDTVAAMDLLVGSNDRERGLPGPARTNVGTWQVPLLDGPLKFRVDFNSCLTEPLFSSLLEQLPPHLRRRLDFIEDPFPYEPEAWCRMQREFGVRLACDKGLARTEGRRSGDAGYEVAVLKPGRRDWRPAIPLLPSSTRIVMTSAMDHAIGQSFAAYEAALAWRELGDRMDLCGLCTEHLFEQDAFFERIQSHGGNLRVDRQGTGLGFDGVLARLPWKRL